MAKASAKNPKAGSDQAQRFKQAAKEVGADESEAAFEETLRRIAKSQTKKEKPAD